VPESLTSASLALGASRWQTVRHIVLPAAAGGIFAAIMLGLGRAIGETMIVLMATGNTPILDLSPFNGFRAMSANIAVEIPEAPVGGTLYHVLFLTAFILFLFTFVINSVAAFIGDRLRKKYARF
jgi:phosphate transport system permease protein